MTQAADIPIDPRTGLQFLSELECWRLPEARGVGRLAVTVGTHPDIFPVNYRARDGRIIVRTDAGTKLAAAVLNGAVAFEIDEIDEEAMAGWSVVVSGWAEEPHRLEAILELDGVDLQPWVDTPKTRWLVIKPETVTGRRVPTAS